MKFKQFILLWVIGFCSVAIMPSLESADDQIKVYDELDTAEDSYNECSIDDWDDDNWDGSPALTSSSSRFIERTFLPSYSTQLFSQLLATRKLFLCYCNLRIFC